MQNVHEEAKNTFVVCLYYAGENGFTLIFKSCPQMQLCYILMWFISSYYITFFPCTLMTKYEH